MRDPLFDGADGLRDKKERRAFIWCVATLPLSLALVGFVLSSAFEPSHLVLIGIGALVYVSIARGRLLGDSIHVHGGQFAELAALVHECAVVLDVPPPQIFIRDDVVVPIVAVGVGDPYALVISSHWLEHFEPNELCFLVARELAHIRAHHTRFTSILSVNGRENVAVSLVFGGYLRRTEYSADRIGMLYCGSAEAASSAIAIASFHSIGRRIDLAQVAEQLREIDAEPTLRAGEWLGSSPYAARRIAQINAFAATPLAQHWLTRFALARRGAASVAAFPRHLIDPESRRGFAGPWRRIAAWCVDAAVIAAVLPSFLGPNPDTLRQFGLSIPIAVSSSMVPILLVLWIYSVVLVTAAGRTIGMMVLDLRVVRDDFGRPSLWNAVARYALAALSVVTIFPLFLWGLRRIQPYDRGSATRLVSASALLEPRRALP